MKKNTRIYNHWTKAEIKYLYNNFLTEKKKIIKDNLNHTWCSILHKADELKIKGRNVQYLGTSVNHDFFKNWSDNMAYVLGFWCADGCMWESSRGFYFSFASNDLEILKKIKLALFSEHQIRTRKKEKCFDLVIGSKTMYNDLSNMGLTPRKSLTLQFPNIPKNYIRPFIRGYFDGDGSFSFKDNKNLTMSITGNKKILVVMKKYIERKSGIQINSFYRSGNKPGCSKNIYKFSCSGISAIKFGRWIYNGNQKRKKIKLKRKYDIFVAAKKYYEKKRKENRKEFFKTYYKYYKEKKENKQEQGGILCHIK